MPYISDYQLEPVLDELVANFEYQQHSDTPIKRVAEVAQQLVIDHGLTDRPRWSLCLMLAKQAKFLWHQRCVITKIIIKNQ